ncbi:MAG: PmbA/TldD protein [Thermoanaerobacterales bacterium 50_218]|nr:MAG: PmbA/TldD protein [Thermoanaerobacterales bacterium 50_218]
MMFSKADLEEILQVAQKGGDFAEIFLEEKRVTRIGCEDKKIERVIAGREEGAGIRVLKGENTAYGYTNDLSKENLLKLAKRVSGAVCENPDASVVINSQKLPVPFPVEKRPDEVPISDKVALVQVADEAARSVDAKLVRQVTVGYGDVVQKVVIANTEGTFVEDERIRTRLAVNVVAADGGVIQTGFEAAGGTQGLELYEEETPWELGRKAANRAILMLKARHAPAGRMPVVLSGEAGGTMIHEACGHGLEADLVQRKLSVYAGKKGEKVASELVTVIDDATLPGKYGSFRCDDEGNPAQRTVLIENGVLQGYLYDHLTARKDGVRPTGNGRRESYQHQPIPRMSNTFLAPGDASPEEIIKETKKGLFVEKMGGGQVNTVNGDFVFEVTEGYLIEDGEVKAPVRGATITGNGPEVLRRIDMVGNDLGFAIGTCGKDGQGVPVSDAQPTIRIPELIVGGILEKEGDQD